MRSLSAAESGKAAIMIILSENVGFVADLPAPLLGKPRPNKKLHGFLTFSNQSKDQLRDSDDHDTLEYFDAEQFEEDEVHEG